jgi:hypothetical protein
VRASTRLLPPLVRVGLALSAVLALSTAFSLSAESFTVSVAHAAAADNIDRRIRDNRITESSGLAASQLHPDVLWTHNDSGNAPRIYAIDKDGSTEAALTVRDEPNVDWEAIAITQGNGGQSLLAVGDIGDNNAEHSSVRIALVREPQKLRTTSVTPVRVLRLRYPDGPRDAEALLADPRNGRLYVVSKGLFGSELYAVPKSVWPNQRAGSGRITRVTTMTKVASMSAGLITDGTFLPSGRMLLRGYGKVSVMDRPETVENGRIATLAAESLPSQNQGESITVADGGRQALIGSEGRREPVLRIPVPAVAGDPSSEGTGSDGTDAGGGPNSNGTNSNGTDSSSPGSNDGSVTLPPGPLGTDSAVGPTTGTVAGQAGSGRASETEPAFVGVGNLQSWALLIGGGLVVVALTFGALMLRSRRH